MTTLDRVVANLRWLPPAYLRLHLELPQQRTNPADRVHTTRTPPLPCSLDMLNLINRGGIVLPLQEWEDGIRELRGFTHRTFTGDTYSALVAVVTFLVNNAPWAEQNHPAWDEFRQEVAWLRRTVERVLDEDERRWTRTRIPCQTDQCTGLLRLDHADPANLALECGQCGARWEPEAFRTLAGYLGGNPVRVDDVAQMLGLSPRILRGWVERGHVPNRAEQPRRVLVLLDDVLDYMRHADARTGS